MRNSFILFLLITSTLVGCQNSNSGSRLVVSFPKASFSALTSGAAKNSGEVGTFSAVDPSLVCFVVNVRGSGIEDSHRNCQPPRGVVGGSVPAGGELSVEVPEGTRNVEIYGMLRASSSAPCPVITATSGKLEPSFSYLLFRQDGVEVRGPTTTLNAHLTFPQRSQHLVGTGAVPANCAVAGTTIRNIRVVSGAFTGQTANGYRATTRLKSGQPEIVTGNGYIYRSRVRQ